MAQDSVADLEAEKKRLTLEKEVVTLRKEIETAKKDLADIVTPAAPTAAERAATSKAEADALTAQYNAQTAASNARVAADSAEIKAMFGTVPTSGVSGSVNVKTDAGKGEATLLSALAVNQAAEQIVKAIDAGSEVLVYAGDARPRFQNWRFFLVRQKLLQQLFSLATDRETAARGAQAALSEVSLSAAGTEAPALAVAGAALEAIKNLGSFFQTDYEIGGIALSPDDQLLTASVMAGLRGKDITVSDPARLAPAIADATLIDLLTPLAEANLDAPQRAADMEALAKEARTRAGVAGTSDALKEKLGNVAAAFDRAAGAWRTAAAGYDQLVKDLATADAAGVLWALKVAEEKAISDALGKGRALFVKVNAAAGGYYTKKNIWTFLGGMPFSVMGGVVVSYVLVDGKTGAVSKAGAIPIHSGYNSVTRVQRLFPSPTQEGERRPRRRGAQ